MRFTHAVTVEGPFREFPDWRGKVVVYRPETGPLHFSPESPRTAALLQATLVMVQAMGGMSGPPLRERPVESDLDVRQDRESAEWFLRTWVFGPEATVSPLIPTPVHCLQT